MVTQLFRVSYASFLWLPLITSFIQFFSPVAPLEGRRTPAARDKKEYGLTGEKGMRLFICGSYAFASDRAVFSAAVNKIFSHLNKVYLGKAT